VKLKNIFSSLLLLAFTAPAAAAPPAPAAKQSNPCGMDMRDWCPAPPGDACGRHTSAAGCRADPACYGMQYRGESVVACNFDERGFASNCSTVGCTGTPPAKQ
jgi:hypothetical protein